MKYMEIPKVIFVRGYFFLGIAAVCLLLTYTIWIVYGEPKTITTDPDYPLGEGGVTNYLTQEEFDSYEFWWGLFSKVGFFSGLTGVLLCLRAHPPKQPKHS
jgi:hypothetical protein